MAESARLFASTSTFLLRMAESLTILAYALPFQRFSYFATAA